jgi:hypothetical protein
MVATFVRGHFLDEPLLSDRLHWWILAVENAR